MEKDKNTALNCLIKKSLKEKLRADAKKNNRDMTKQLSHILGERYDED